MLDGDLAWALAGALHFEWEDDERELLAPLVDATIMRVQCERLEELARPIVATLWEGLQPLLADELQAQAKRDAFVAEALEDALADLELGPARSRLAGAVVQQAAHDLADHSFFLEDCLDCIEDGLARAPSNRRDALVDRAAAALALHDDEDFGVRPPTDAQRRRARAHVAGMALLGADSLPRLSQALVEVAAEPLPGLSDDRVLRAVVSRRLAAVADLN